MSQTTTTTSAAIAPVTGTLRCGVVGVGRMGMHHARKYASLDGTELVGVVDQDETRRDAASDELSCAAVATHKELLTLGVDAVSIAVPTSDHLRVARPFLDAGVACLIEKPLASSVEEAEALCHLADGSGAVLMVGHIERFNPAVRALQRAGESMTGVTGTAGIVPRFIEVTRVSPMTFRSVDVSAVMDMMIHDLDVVLWLMDGHEPDDVQASGVNVLTEHEDVCSARLTFNLPHGRCVANISCSRLALKTERKIRITGENAYVSIDYAKKTGVLLRRTANELQMQEVRDALRTGTDLSDLDYSELVDIEPLDIDHADQLELEISSFLDAVRTGSRSPIDARAGFAAVRTAERIMAECRQDWPSYNRD